MKKLKILSFILGLSFILTGCSSTEENEEPGFLEQFAKEITYEIIKDTYNNAVYSNNEISDIFEDDIENLEINNLLVGQSLPLEEGLNVIYRYNSKQSILNEKILREFNIKHNIYFYEEYNEESINTFFKKVRLIIAPEINLIQDISFMEEYSITPLNIYIYNGKVVLIRQGAYEDENSIDIDEIYYNKIKESI